MHRAEARYAAPASDDELIRRHASLIDRVARRVASRMQLPDGGAELWSAGALGLLDAARRFDGARDVRFETFAEHRIRGAMLDEVRNLDHLPRRLRAQTEQVNKARERLTRSLGRAPQADELARALDVDIEALHALEIVAQRAAPLADALKIAADSDNLDEAYDRQRMSLRLTNAVSQLDDRCQTLLSLYYVEGLTFREVAKLLDLSEARVSQLHRESLEALRVKLAPEP